MPCGSRAAAACLNRYSARGQDNRPRPVSGQMSAAAGRVIRGLGRAGRRRELLDRLLIVKEYHLRRVLTEYVLRFNTGRSCFTRSC
jgi:hypothetical protein